MEEHEEALDQAEGDCGDLGEAARLPLLLLFRLMSSGLRLPEKPN